MTRSAWGAAAVLVFAASGVPAVALAPAAAADTTITPTTTQDVVDPDDEHLSLREAVALANQTAGRDTIALDRSRQYVIGGTCESPASDPTLRATDPDGLVVDGNGSSIRQVGPGGAWGCEHRVLFNGPGLLELRDVTITGGAADMVCSSAGCPSVASWGRGGGVYSEGPLLLTDGTVVTGNHAALTGGGVEARSTLEGSDASIHANRSGIGAGVRSLGTVTLDHTRIWGNHAEVHPDGGWVSAGVGGGIASDAAVTANDSYIADNVAEAMHGEFPGPGRSGGIDAPSVSLTDTLVTGNVAQDAIGIEGTIHPATGGGVAAESILLDQSTVVANVAGRAPQLLGLTLDATRSVIGGGPEEVSCGVSNGTSSGGYNVVGGGTCGLGGGPGDRTHVPGLTPTPPADGRLSIIPPAACGADPDRDGDPRPLGGACEAGSDEVGGAAGPHATPTVLAPSGWGNVPPNRADAVDWAATHGVLQTPGGWFGADQVVTRGQAVAALWRTFGAPRVGRTGMPYADVPRTAAYRPAVKWALSAQALTALPGERFRPKRAVDRATFVTLLWHAAGSPDTGSTQPFPSIPHDAPYRQAANWAAVARIVAVGDGQFRPLEPLTRADVAQTLFLAASSPRAWTEVDPPPTNNL